jgi:hypothetical protein
MTVLADLNDREFAIWTAGFFEGEGCITVNRPRSAPPTPQVDIAQSGTLILKQICSRYNGELWDNRRDDGVSHLKWFGVRVTNILIPILPYLIIKRERALIALEMLPYMGQQGHHISEEWAEARHRLAERLLDA